MIGQTEFFITPQCTKHTYGACIIIVHMHGAHVRFFVCEKSEKFRDSSNANQSKREFITFSFSNLNFVIPVEGKEPAIVL